MGPRDPLDVEARRRIYEALQAAPGAHFSKLKRDLELGTGTLQHHLRVLVERDLVTVREDGRYTRYFPGAEVDRRDKRVLGLLRQETPRRVVVDLIEHGRSRLTEISGRLDLAPSTVSFHLDKLMDAGVALKPARGRYELVDEDRLADLLVTYRESFADRAVDRLVSLFTELDAGVGGDP